MANREKIIEGLEYLVTAYAFHGDDAQCLGDAIDLLKEQESFKPRYDDIFGNRSARCGYCNAYIVGCYRYCPGCGRSVKWDA